MKSIDCNKETLEKLEADICIVGSGAVGLSMAIAFMKNPNIKVALIESGGEEPTGYTYNLNKMSAEPIQLMNPPEASRLRMLGGSTNCWGGWCRPISKQVFKNWPITQEHMLEHQAEADSILQLKTGNYDKPEDWFLEPDQKKIYYGENFETTIRQVKNIRLWRQYKVQVEASPNIQIAYNLSAYNVEVNNDSGVINTLICKNTPGKITRVKAKKFVFAAGGLENPVLLLNMDRLNNGFFSKRTKLIGNYYSDHKETGLEYLPLSAFVPKFKDFHYTKEGEMFYHWVRMAFSLNTNLFPELKDIPHAVGFAFHPKNYAGLGPAKEPITFNTSSLCSSNSNDILPTEIGALLYASKPIKENRISLANEKNALGHFRGKIYQNIPADEIELFNSLVKRLDSSFRKSGLARINIGKRLYNGPYTNIEKKQVYNGRHHMGGTRMALKPSEGVVDTNLKFFNVPNLYIAGPGVFPSFDWHGPTYSAVMLGVRLKNHLLKA